MDYHDRPELSSTQIAAYLRDPILWYHHYIAKDWPKPEASAEMALGTIIHKACEIGSLDQACRIKHIPPEVLNADGHCKGKAWTDWKSANPADKYLKPGETDNLEIIWQHLQEHWFCRRIIAEAEKEVEHIWHEPYLGDCRCRFDAVLNDVLIDWKTTRASSQSEFEREVAYHFYDVRLALYRLAFLNLYGTVPDVHLVAIQTSGGCGVNVYRLTDEWLSDAEARLIVAVDDMRRFNLSRYLNQPVVDLQQPKYLKTKLESINAAHII